MEDNRSVLRCLALLRAFRRTPRQTLGELSKAVEIPHSTVLRFLNTLEREGYVRRDGNLWSLGPQMLDLGFSALEGMGINESVKEVLQRLADACAGTVNIGEKSKDDVVVLARVASAQAHLKLFIVNLRVGSVLPHESALYRALGMGHDEWCVAEYPDIRHLTLAMPLRVSPSRSLSIGLSVDSDQYPMERVEGELLDLLRNERRYVERLMTLETG